MLFKYQNKYADAPSHALASAASASAIKI